jgi:hypothetical protein
VLLGGPAAGLGDVRLHLVHLVKTRRTPEGCSPVRT